MTEGFQQGGEGGAGAGAGGGGGQDFLASLPADLRGHGALKNYSGPDGAMKLAKSHVELTQAFSRRDMAELDPPSDPAKRKAVLAKLGHAPPETPDAYGIPDTGMGKDFRAWAHKHGLTVDQAKGLFGDFESAREAQRRGFEERQGAKAKETETTLRTEWGQQYEANMELVNRAREHFLPEDARKVLDAAGLNHHPAMVKLMADLGRALKEGTMHSASGSGGGAQAGTLEQAQREMSAYFQQHGKLITSQNDMSPEVQQAKKRYGELRRRAAELSLAAKQAGAAGGSAAGGAQR